MSKPLLRTDKEIADIYMRHSKTVYRVCFSYMKNNADSEDAVQETFFKLISKGPAFLSTEHEKAWLIRTASNICKNSLRHWWHKRENIDKYYDIQVPDKHGDTVVLETIMELPEKYRIVVYLYYYEGYNSSEIAGILKKPQSTIRNYLHEARKVLKERLGDVFNDQR